ncbi:hypothetical protein DIPPA_04076 [Diplonema papillatum]|nr:hypothetical protein DIPPA_04076 [Diplonema papillatum]
MCELLVRCNSKVGEEELENMLHMPGFKGLSIEVDDDIDAMDKTWCVRFADEETANAAQFAAGGKKSREGFTIFVTKKKERGAVAAPPLLAADDVEPSTDLGKYLARHREVSELQTVDLTEFEQPTKRAKTEPALQMQSSGAYTFVRDPEYGLVPEWKLHIPPRPRLVLSPKSYLPAKMTVKDLKLLRIAGQAFHERSPDSRKFLVDSRVNVSNDGCILTETRSVKDFLPPSLSAGNGDDTIAPVELLPSIAISTDQTRPATPPPVPAFDVEETTLRCVGLSWTVEKPNFKALKKAVSRKAHLVQCDVVVAKKVAVMAFDKEQDAEAALRVVQEKALTATLLPMLKVPSFLAGAVGL